MPPIVKDKEEDEEDEEEGEEEEQCFNPYSILIRVIEY